MTETFALIAIERRRLAAGLAELDDEQWSAPSLCAGWDAHTVAAHLNAPWAVSIPTAMWAVIRHGGLARGFNQVALDLANQLDPQACVAGLEEHAEDRFVPPFSPPTAPLTDVIVHGGDILTPFGRSVDVAPQALAAVMEWLCAGRAKGFVTKERVSGLRFVATDIELIVGDGNNDVVGPALSICQAVTGRPRGLLELDGAGLTLLASRLGDA